MRLTVDRLNLLVEYGLTEYQARVYLALLDFPSLPAGALAKAAQIPRNRLYEVLEELQSMGLIDILQGETRQYRANPLSSYLDRSVSDLKERIDRIEAQKSYLAAAFQPPALAESGDLEAGTTSVLLTRRAVAREADRIVDEAKDSLVVVGSEGGWERILHHLSRLPEEPTKLRLEIFLPRVAATTGGIERLGEGAVNATRWLELPTRTLCFVRDETEMLLIHPIPDDEKPRAGRDFALLTTNPAFVRDHLTYTRAAARPPNVDGGEARIVARVEPR
jgi:sugar-specific transcriptional regulator TrmB